MIATLFSSFGFAIILMLAVLVLYQKRKKCRPRWVFTSLSIILMLAMLPALAICLYLSWFIAAGQPEAKVIDLKPGILYERRVFDKPRPTVMHLLTIDRQRTPLKFIGSPVDATTSHVPKHRAATTSTFLEQSGADIAFNASFFKPFHDNHLFDSHPGEDERVEPIGYTRIHGVSLGTAGENWPSVNFTADGRISFENEEENAEIIIAASHWLVRDGIVSSNLDNTKPYPRTAIGVSEDTRTIIILIVDGAQPRYSNGLTMYELAKMLKELGMYHAVNLDGGGSSTLVFRNPRTGQPETINRPIHNKIPGRERPVANHIGIKFDQDSSG